MIYRYQNIKLSRNEAVAQWQSFRLQLNLGISRARLQSKGCRFDSCPFHFFVFYNYRSLLPFWFKRQCRIKIHSCMYWTTYLSTYLESKTQTYSGCVPLQRSSEKDFKQFQQLSGICRRTLGGEELSKGVCNGNGGTLYHLKKKIVEILIDSASI